MIKRYLKEGVLPKLFLLATIVFVFTFDLQIAKHKNFWLDEGYELQVSCAHPFSTLLSTGETTQCSPQPFYYLVQKAAVNLLPAKDENILVSFRIVSLVSAALVVLVIALMTKGVFGWWLALVPLVPLLKQEIFHYYSAESRPYMMWLLFLALLIWQCSMRKKNFTVLGAIAMGLTATSGPGMLQVLAAMSACVFIDFIRREKIKSLLKYGAMAGLSMALGLYYALNGCKIDLNHNANLLLTGDPELVFKVIELIWIPGKIFLVFNFLALAGLIYPFYKIVRRKHPAQDPVFDFSVHVVAQLLATLVIAGLVIYKQYYFIQRIFLHLIVIQALLVLTGFAWMWSLIKNNLKYQKSLLLVCFGLVSIFLGIRWNKNTSIHAVDNQPTIHCLNASRSVTIYDSPGASPEMIYNYFANLAKRLKQCPSLPTGNTYVVLDAKKQFNEQIFLHGKPHSAEPIQACGKQLLLEVNP